MKMQQLNRIWGVVVLLLILAACSPAATQEVANSQPESQVWFDAPLPGSVFPPGEVQLIAHAADEIGLSEMEFSLPGGPVIGNQSAEQGSNLSTAALNWHPPEPGHYMVQFRALNVNGDWSEYAFTEFDVSGDETPTPSLPPADEPDSEEPTPTETTEPPTDTPEPCTDRAAFVSETILDDTVFKPGTAFTKTWTLRNAGTCAWTTGYALSFYDGEQMGGPGMILLTTSVAPGESITLAVNLTAPNQNGTYKGRWMLMNEAGNLFGLGENGKVAFWVQIIVQREDRQAPTVEATYSPNGRGEPTGRQKVTFSASASDNIAVTKIEIYLQRVGGNWQLLTTCSNQVNCSIETGPLNIGDYRLRAYGYDASGNQGDSGVVNFSVVP